MKPLYGNMDDAQYIKELEARCLNGVAKIDRLTAEVSELKEDSHKAVQREIERIRDEFRVKEVHERRGGADYLLPIENVYSTPQGLVVIVSAVSGTQELST